MTTAFVLSGGGSLGAVQVGMLGALSERGVEPDLLAGTSAGAINAAFVGGHGMGEEALEKLAGLWRSLRRGADDVHLLPTGLTQPAITMLGQGKVSGKAVVDLDIVRQKQSSGSWFDPTSYLTGKLPVTASGRIVTWDGKGKFELDTAEISGVPIPKSFLAQMVNFFTRTADTPKGSSIDDTFELPAKNKRIDVEQGRFVLHQ